MYVRIGTGEERSIEEVDLETWERWRGRKVCRGKRGEERRRERVQRRVARRGAGRGIDREGPQVSADNKKRLDRVQPSNRSGLQKKI